MPEIKIREGEIAPIKPVSEVPSSSDRKGKRVLDEEAEVYSRNIKAHNPDVAFINLITADMAVRFNKASRCLLSKADLDYLDTLDPVVRAEQAHTTLAEVTYHFSDLFIILRTHFSFVLTPSIQGLLRMFFETTKIK